MSRWEYVQYYSQPYSWHSQNLTLWHILCIYVQCASCESLLSGHLHSVNVCVFVCQRVVRTFSLCECVRFRVSTRVSNVQRRECLKTAVSVSYNDVNCIVHCALRCPCASCVLLEFCVVVKRTEQWITRNVDFSLQVFHILCFSSVYCLWVWCMYGRVFVQYVSVIVR